MMSIVDRVIRTGIERAVDTTAAGEQSFAYGAEERQRQTELWHALTDRLLDLVTNASDLAADGILPPSAATVSLAGRFAMAIRDHGCLAPQNAVPDGEGGIALEQRHGPFFQSIQIHADGSIEVLSFRNSRLIGRYQINFPFSPQVT